MEPVTCDALNALREALCNEQEALDFYNKAAERTLDEKGMAMYRDLAAEAQLRLDIVQRQIDLLTAGGTWELPECVFSCEADLEEPLYPRGEKALKEAVDPFDNALEAIEFGLEAANNGYDLYARHAAQCDDPKARLLYQYLAQASRNQFNLLMSNYETLNTLGGWV